MRAALAGCDRAPKEPEKASRADVAPSAPATPPPPVQLPARLTRPAPERLVAIADLHGDLEAVQKAFRLAGAVDHVSRLHHDQLAADPLVLRIDRDGEP
ncbi:MAG: hypothetical protein EOP08_09710, partial [Proteobacteria bacterium]